MVNVKSKQLNICFALLIFMIVLNFLLKPSFLVVQTISLGFVILIYFKFSETLRKFLYYNVLVFGIIDFSMTYTIQGYDLYFFYILLFSYYAYILYKNKFRLPSFQLNNKYNIFLLIFMLYMIFSLIISNDKFASFKSMINYFWMIGFLVMIVKENKNKNDVSQFVRLLSFFYFIVLILGSLEVLGIRYNLRNHSIERGLTEALYPFIKRVPVVFFYNPNNYAMVLGIGMIITALCFFYSYRKREKLYYVAIYILAEINLIFTTSRTGWISIIIALAFGAVAFIYLKERDNWKKMVVVTVLTFALLYGISLVPNMGDYYGKFTHTPIINVITGTSGKKENSIKDIATIGDSGSVNERVTIIYDIVRGVLVKGNVLGFGVGNTASYLIALDNTHGIYYPHSLWFEILGDYGIGIFIYSIFLYLSLMLDTLKCYKLYKNKYYMCSFVSLFSFILLSFGPSTVFDLPIFYLLLGTTVGLVKNKEKINLSLN